MNGFEEQEIGLFTFYREQAELEKQLKQQKKQKARLRKQRYLAEKLEKEKKAQEERLKRKKIKQELEKHKEKTAVKKDYAQQAKNYIKELEMYGPYRARIHNHNRQLEKEEEGQSLPKHKYFSVNMSREEAKSDLSSAFRPKKENFSKLEYYYFDRIAILPKDFGDLDKIMQESKEKEEQKERQSKSTHNRNLSEKAKSMVLKKKQKMFPQLSKNIQPHRSEIQNLTKLYNHKSILQNNEKYFGRKSLRIKPRSLAEKQKHRDLKTNMGKEQMNGADTVLIELLKKYPILQ